MNYANIRCDATYVSGKEGNEIEITSRFESWFAQFRQHHTHREGGVGEEAKLFMRRLFIRFHSKVIAGFRVACSRASRGWVNSSDSVVCTEHSRGIDNSHDRRDESAGITLRDEFASVNLARISQTHDTHIEPAMRPTNCTLATHGNFLLLPPLSCNYYIGVKSIYTSRI